MTGRTDSWADIPDIGCDLQKVWGQEGTEQEGVEKDHWGSLGSPRKGVLRQGGGEITGALWLVHEDFLEEVAGRSGTFQAQV